MEKVYPYRRWQDWAAAASVWPILIAIFLALRFIAQAGLVYKWLAPFSLVAQIIVFPFEIMTGVLLKAPILLVAVVACFILICVLSIVDMRVGLWSIREIILSDTGITFKRRRPVIIEKITNISPIGRASAKRPERGLKIEGLTPEGEKITRKVFRAFGLTKRWEEFKEDLRKLESKNNT